MINQNFWKNKRVFITGHTGFKGAWLCMWLHLLEADITGFSLDPPTQPNLFELCELDKLVHSIIGDVRDINHLQESITKANPEIVIHMAAQSLVKQSYNSPVETYSTNIMGTVHIFEAVRSCENIKAVLNVTTDKCYENRGWIWGYRENDRLGGYDPYSSSKACSELITSSYRDSFFPGDNRQDHRACLATARAGNVIGGGDWADDRLIPDCIKALIRGEKVKIRCPAAVRPWQHVIELLCGYLILIQKMYANSSTYGGSWNFGPNDDDGRTVEWVVSELCTKWKKDITWEIEADKKIHETNYLRLDNSKAKALLGWSPQWRLENAIDKVVEWTKAYMADQDVREVCLMQIKDYMNEDP